MQSEELHAQCPHLFGAEELKGRRASELLAHVRQTYERVDAQRRAQRQQDATQAYICLLKKAAIVLSDDSLVLISTSVLMHFCSQF